VTDGRRMDTQHEWANRKQASGKTFIAFIRLFNTNFSVILESVLRVGVRVSICVCVCVRGEEYLYKFALSFWNN